MGSIKGLQVTNAFLSVGASEAIGMGHSKKNHTKTYETRKPLQTKIDQELFLLKNWCLCHSDECYQLIPFFTVQIM